MARAIRFLLLSLLSAALLVYGCAGGGGVGGGGSQFLLIPTAATVGWNGQVKLVATLGGLPVDVTWAVTSGSITPTSVGNATFTAPASSTTETITAALVSDPGTTRTSSVTAQAGLATVVGRVISGTTFAGVGNVPIEFRDAGGTVVAITSTFSTGYFSAAVPATATRFHLRNTGFPFGFHKQYTFNGKSYAVTITTCSAPLPAISANTNTTLPTNIVIPPSFQPPPPPPDGCT